MWRSPHRGHRQCRREGRSERHKHATRSLVYDDDSFYLFLQNFNLNEPPQKLFYYTDLSVKNRSSGVTGEATVQPVVRL